MIDLNFHGWSKTRVCSHIEGYLAFFPPKTGNRNNADRKCRFQFDGVMNVAFFRVGLIFSNWLLMYLSTEEVRALFTRLLSWLDEEGVLFFRESCFQQSGKQTFGT